MNQKLIISSAFASLLALGVISFIGPGILICPDDIVTFLHIGHVFEHLFFCHHLHVEINRSVYF